LVMEANRHKIKTTGRPVKAIKKDVRACIRFTRPEYFIVKEKAGKVGMKPSAYLRQLAIHTIIISRLTDEEREFARMLVGMANNMNQIAKSCHQEGALRAMVYFESYRARLDEILRKLKA
jgi:superfamily II helicase